MREDAPVGGRETQPSPTYHLAELADSGNGRLAMSNVPFRRVLASVTACLFGALLYCGPASAAPMNQYQLLQQIPATVLDTVTNNAEPDANGGVQLNRATWTDIIYQRVAIPLIYVGAVEGDTSKIDDGWKAIDYANAHINPDGSFQTARGREMNESEMVFWIEAVTNAFSVLDESPLRARYAARMNDALGYIRKNVDWLNTDTHIQALLRFDEPAANRLLLDASAFAYASNLLGDPSLQARATFFQNVALDHENSSGVFLEEKGYDSSYQGVSLLHATHYALIAGNDAIKNALLVATNREVEAVDENGAVDSTNNTRTGGSHMVNGHPYAVDYRSIVLGLYYAGIYLGDSSAISAAERVFSRVFHKSASSHG